MPIILVPEISGWYMDEYDADRFWSRVNFHGGTDHENDPLATAAGECWTWTGWLGTGGYGRFKRTGKVWLCHRIAFLDCGGKIPEDLDLDHLCRNRLCVNPAHLEPVTQRENTMRGLIPNRDTCKHGHPLTPENTYVSHERNFDRLVCKACKHIRYLRSLRKPGRQP